MMCSGTRREQKEHDGELNWWRRDNMRIFIKAVENAIRENKEAGVDEEGLYAEGKN